ncbi:MAG: NADH-quinone oxidoreductase subunit M [Actinomycetota bacterium]|nr:NADH-quinone oxidoreductase subunit M [Actinomycetota bacterium]
MTLRETFASDQIGFPILTALIVLPLVCAAVVALLPDRRSARTAAFSAALAELALAVVLLLAFTPGVSDIQFTERVTWMETVGAQYHVGVDGISVLFIPLTAFITVLVVLFSWNSPQFLSKPYFVAVLGLEAATVGVFASLDLVLFFLFWELMLVPSYFLINLWGGGPQRQHAGLKYVVYMLVGSAPMLIGIVLLGANYGDSRADGGGPPFSFDFVTLLATPISPELQTVVFFLFAFAFAVKGPLVPFHTWMPTALLEGPIGMGMFLVGLKLGVYGFLRFTIPLLPDAVEQWSWLLAVLGALAVVYAGLIALVQRNLRRLLAFAGTSHVGLALLGAFSLNVQGIQGALFVMINAGLASAGLLLLAGFLHARTGSSDLSRYGGLARRLPLLACFFFIVGLALIGLPGTSGFVGEFLVLLGAFRAHWALAAVAVLGVVLSAAYLLTYYERAFLGPATRAATETLRDLGAREAGMAAVISAAILWVGLFPGPFLEITRGSVEALAEYVDRGTPAQASDDGYHADRR